MSGGFPAAAEAEEGGAKRRDDDDAAPPCLPLETLPSPVIDERNEEFADEMLKLSSPAPIPIALPKSRLRASPVAGPSPATARASAGSGLGLGFAAAAPPRPPPPRGRRAAAEAGVAGAVEDGDELPELGDGEVGDLAAVDRRRRRRRLLLPRDLRDQPLHAPDPRRRRLLDRHPLLHPPVPRQINGHDRLLPTPPSAPLGPNTHTHHSESKP
uniref:Uncharacterized protein n=1 Tax=Ananas comosus var. bracteatus TaxID=296719 RepID=A0A6V7P9J3_ANACO|nr:unnamed protein product [Ananas comosus var. bracteatus]